MTQTRTVVAISSVSKSQLRDDLVEQATANGFTTKELASYLRQQEYRKMYAQRPDVIAKRKAYTQARYLRMKQLKELLSAN